jgi:FG-GAP repeat
MAAALLAAGFASLSFARLPSRAHSPISRASVHAAHRAGLASLPAAALGPVSSALGADNGVYRVRASAAGLSAVNPSQGLHARFTPRGVTIVSGATSVHLRLTAIGYGGAPAPTNTVTPEAQANRVSYAHAWLREWYENGPAGIEQGFTIARAPSARARGPLTLAMVLSGNAGASLTAGDRAIVLSHGGASSLRYGKLAVTDAAGHSLHSWLALDGRTLLVRVDAHDARYPLRIDPLVQDGGKLTPSDEEHEPAEGSEAGTSVAISADGNTALIGGIGDEGGKAVSMAGAAWVFTRSGSTWKQQAKLVGGEEEGEGQFGISVALSSDGNTALIGGINDKSAGKEFGAAWVFTRSAGKWTQQGEKLTGIGEEAEGGRFGKSVALSSDGNTALIGAYFDAGGSAFVFTRSGSSWKQQGEKLTGKGEEGEGEFGLSAALSADGDTALIGGPVDGTVPMTGAAWVFTRSGSTWKQQQELKGAHEEGAGEFGTSVALSADGNTALAGGPGDDSAGAAWAFTRSGSTWTQQGEKLTPSDASGSAAFGAGVALSGDGNTALIGGPTDMGKVPTGAAWEFTRSGSTWSQQGAKLRGSDVVPESEFGAAVSLAASGETALIGGPIDNGNLGAAWIFAASPPTVITDAATNLTNTTATLNGTVTAGASSTAYFQYGTTTGYGAATPGQGLGAAGSDRPLAATIGGLAPGTTYHFRIVAENPGGVSVGTDQVFTTAVPTVLQTTLAPVISAVSQSHRTWREGRKLASVSRRRPPIGTTFSFSLNEKASVSFAFTRRVGGRRVKGRCVAQTKRNRHMRACRRTVTIATLVFSAHAGVNRVSFQGRISHSRKLEPGGYAVVIAATNTTRQRSNTKTLSFTIVK